MKYKHITDNKEKIIKEYLSGKNTVQLGNQYDVSTSTIIYRLKKWGVPIRGYYNGWNKGTKGVMKAWNKGIKTGMAPWQGKKRENMKGENNWKWKGDDVGYYALHAWIARELGKPQHCSICNDTSDRIYDWANVSGEYLRIKADWIRLCKKCHADFDKDRITAKDRFKKDGDHYKERIVSQAF